MGGCKERGSTGFSVHATRSAAMLTNFYRSCVPITLVSFSVETGRISLAYASGKVDVWDWTGRVETRVLFHWVVEVIDIPAVGGRGNDIVQDTLIRFMEWVSVYQKHQMK